MGDVSDATLGRLTVSGRIPGTTTRVKSSAAERLADAALIAAPVGEGAALARMAPRAARALRGGREIRSAAEVGEKAAKRGLSKTERARRAAQRLKLEAEYQSKRAALAAAGAGSGAAGAREAARRADGPVAGREVARRVLTAPGRATARGAKNLGRGLASPAAAPVAAPAASERGVQNLATAPMQLGRVAVEHPGEFAGATFRSTRDMLLGVPAAIKQIIESPPDAARQMVADFKQRYGPLIEGNPEEFRRIALESGATPYLLDAMIGATPGSQVVGRAAKAGTLGARAERFANRARPARQLTPAEAVVPRSSSGIIGMGAQAVSDRLAQRRTVRRAASEDAMAATAKELGSVVPLRSSRALHMGSARTKAVFRQMMMGEQGQVLAHATGLIKQMSKTQRTAVKDALDLGIRTPDQARELLTARVLQIHKNRGGKEFGKLDNIPELLAVVAKADEIFTPEFGRLVDKLRATEKRAVGKNTLAGERSRKSDPGLSLEQAAVRRHMPLAESLGIKRLDGESNVEFLARVNQARKERGLASPGYFPSELSRRRRFAERAVGGTRASHRTKPYSGELFRKGIENRDVSVVASGLARNVKRRYNWNLVSEVVEKNAFEWGRGKSIKEQIAEMGRLGIKEESVRFMNPGLLRKFADQADTEGPRRSLGQTDDRMADTGVQEALAESVKTKKAFEALPEEFRNAPGWYAVPKQVADELEAGFKATRGGRVLDVLQEKGQRYMLAMNSGWLIFQGISNIGQALAAGATPFDMAKGMWVMRRLNADERNQLAAHVGLAQANEMRQATQLGAASTGGMVEAYRLMKESKFGRTMAKANPIDAFFRIAHQTDNIPRTGVIYKLAKKEAYKRANVSAHRLWGEQGKAMRVFSKDADAQIAELLKNPRFLEDATRELNEFMGDYTTFTAAERTYLKRLIPFYSWIRFSVRFAFYTMPTRHPLITGLLYQLGRLETDEVKELLGGDELPWALGKLYFNDGKTAIDFYRANPALNAVVELESVRDATSLMPPWMKVAANQLAQQDLWSGKPWKVQGEAFARKAIDPGAESRIRAGLNELLSTFAPYRAVHKARAKGESLGADSLAWDLRPVGYSDRSITAMRKADFERRGGAWGVFRENFIPILPKSSEDIKGMIEYEQKRRKEERQRIENAARGGSKPAGGSAFNSAGMWAGQASKGYDSGSMWGGN